MMMMMMMMVMKEKTAVSVIFEDDDEIEVRIKKKSCPMFSRYNFACNIDYLQPTFNMLGCNGKQTF